MFVYGQYKNSTPMLCPNDINGPPKMIWTLLTSVKGHDSYWLPFLMCVKKAMCTYTLVHESEDVL